MKSTERGGGAASGGNFSEKTYPFSLKVWEEVAALPPAAIFFRKMIPFPQTNKNINITTYQVFLDADGRLGMGVWGAEPPTLSVS